MPLFRGAIRVPKARLFAIPTFLRIVALPAFWGIVPGQLSTWGNNQFGDCHKSDSEVLTEHGWCSWPEYDGKALLGTMNRDTGRLEFQAPLSVVRREHDGPMAFSTHQSVDFAVTPNHGFWIQKYVIPKQHRSVRNRYVAGSAHYGPMHYRTAAELPTRFRIPGTTTGFMGTQIDQITVGSRRWDGTDFLRLLAAIISDGYASSGETNRDRISFCCFRDDRREMVQSLANRLGIAETSRRGVWEFRDGSLAEWLRANIYTSDVCRSPFKQVPDLVKVASQNQIEEFLRFFGDQSLHEGGNRHFYSSSRRLIDDLQELLLRIGRRGSIYERGIREGGCNEGGKRIEQKHEAFELYEFLEGDYLGFSRLSRNRCIEFDHYKGEVFCATVPNSTLVTRRNGSILISSNCVSAEEAFAKAAWSLMCGLPETFVTEATVIAWARKHGYLNGADLVSVMDSMARDGMQASDGRTYTDGPYHTVDWTNAPLLNSAIYTGPVKIAVSANQLESAGAGSRMGWFLHNARRDQATDHCVALSGFGSVGDCFNLLGMPAPSGANASEPAYLLYTWNTIGVITAQSMVAITDEAYVRNPTTAEQPAPAPTPTPTPTPPPGPGPAPIPGPPGVTTVDFGASGRIVIDPATQTLTGSAGWTFIPGA